jgi:unsaturated rhamnogalacturonyl hydrolase
MWLDGIYMADVFLLQYAGLYNQLKYRDEAVEQISLIYRHTRDSKTGLLYHGWDESINKIWANPKTGTSPEFWGRGLGWYMMALADVLDYLPENYSKRDSIVNIFKELSLSVSNFQDTSTGLWYQVVDKARVAGNWPESSCTAMFAYAFTKGYKKGFLDKKYFEQAQKAFNGLINNNIYFDNEGKIYLTGTVKVGTLNFKSSDGSFGYYISVDRRTNDFKGLAALLYLSMALEYL